MKIAAKVRHRDGAGRRHRRLARTPRRPPRCPPATRPPIGSPWAPSSCSSAAATTATPPRRWGPTAPSWTCPGDSPGTRRRWSCRPLRELAPGPWVATVAGTLTAWSGPWGVSFTANLTPDPETGLGKWTEEEFLAALQTGRHQGRGRQILPPMPWQAVFDAPRGGSAGDLGLPAEPPAGEEQGPGPDRSGPIAPPARAARSSGPTRGPQGPPDARRWFRALLS